MVADDADLGESLVAFAPNEKHRDNKLINGLYDPGEYIYRDVDNSGTVNANDVRLTDVGVYLAGSTVGASHADVIPKSLISLTSITGTSPWSYIVTDTSETAFDQAGTYKFQFRNTLKTAASGTDKYVQVNWDDIGLELVLITVTEGSTLKTGGPTFLMWNYDPAGYISFTESITGVPYVNAWPVPGNYTLLTINMLVGYGNATLDLYDTVLRTLDVNNNPVSYAHTSVDGYFSNKLYGDVDSDRDVDEYDLESFNDAYGSENGNCDFNKDNIVGVIDLFSLGKNYGEEV